MALRIVWAPKAKEGFDQIINYLSEEWTEKEVRSFVKKSFEFFELLSKNPELLERSGKQKNLRRGPINKHTILTYRIKPRNSEIEFVSIRGSKQKKS